ncbi:MAG: FkbM family methyltransferase, partial [Clostridia bacterium]|nr:FkbM family methyltransferase [Clostridia bacterium]
QRIAADPRPTVVYGMGNGADKLFDKLSELGVPVAAVMASDGFVRGQSFRGFTVRSFYDIRNEFSDFQILVAFASRVPEVMELLHGMSESYTLRMPDMPVAGEEYFTSEFYRAHFDEIVRAGELLSDEESKAVYYSVLEYKLTGEIAPLFTHTVDKNGLYAALPCEKFRRVLDLGAYNGDTLKEAVEFFPNLTEAVAVEPDPKTFRRLCKYVDSQSAVKVTPVNAAVYSGEGNLVFHSSGNRNSGLSGASYQHTDAGVPTVSVDTLCREFTPDFIKFDVEGAEREALLGAETTLRGNKPALLVSVYHRSEDIFALALLLAERHPGYCFALRRISCLPAWEADLLALPLANGGEM